MCDRARRRSGGRRGGRRATRCSTRPGSSADEIADALGGVGSQGRHAVELAADAVPGRSSAAAGAGCSSRRPPAAGERVLVALSGGVDSAVAALLERERGAEVVAVTLKLWADRRTDAARSCCSPLAVLGARGARPLARDPASHPRPRGSLPAPGRRRLHRRLPRRPDAEPVRDLQRRAADRRDDRARRPGRRLDARDRPLRTVGRRRRGAAAPRRRRLGQGPDLHALRTAPRVVGQAPLPAGRADQAARCERSPRPPACRWRRSARARTSASSPARASARSWPATPASPSAPATSSIAAGAGSVATAAITSTPSASGAGSGSSSPEPLYVLGTDAENEHRHRRAARGARLAARRRARRDPAPTERTRGPRAASLPLQAARLPASPVAARASTTACGSSSPSPPTVSPRARPPACSTAIWWSAGRRSPSRAPWRPRRRGAGGRGRPPRPPRRRPSRNAWWTRLGRRPQRRCRERSSRVARRRRPDRR